MTVGIVGLGLIGGSMAKAVKARTKARVLGFDRDRAVQGQALAEGVLDGVLTPDSLPRCTLLLLALYPQASLDYLTENADRITRGTAVVDLCGVKRFVCEGAAPLARLHGFHFVGGHPMAGREVSGYGASRETLFQNASMLLTPEESTPERVLAQLREFFLALGFDTVHLTHPEEHDRIIAYTSQLAHVLSSAYVKSPAALYHKQFSGGSFQDLTRVATLNEEMWTQLFLLNRDFLLEELEGLRDRLGAYAEALRSENGDSLRALLREGCEWKERIVREREKQDEAN